MAEAYKMKLKPLALRTCIFFSFLSVSLPLGGQTPGGYGAGLRFWIKGNAGTFSNAGTTPVTNGNLIQQWNDQSGVNNHAIQTTGTLKPTYFSAVSNGNPGVRFAGTHFLDATTTTTGSGTSDYCIFVVVKLTSATAGGPTDGDGSYILDRTTATNQLYSLKVVASGGTNRFLYQKRSDGNGNLGGPMSTSTVDNANFQIISMNRIYNSGGNTLSRIYVNGLLEATQSNASETTTPPLMRIGRHATIASNGMTGDLTEMIVYNNDPSTANRQKVESYLAVKYGISLSQSTLRDYYSSTGGVIYPATASGYTNYITTITGIGMDNGSGLNQTDSKNQSTNDYVRMQNPSAFGDGDYVLWGSNNGTMITPNMADIGGPILRRLSRVWRVAVTGTPGSVMVTVDLSAVPGTKNQSSLRLLIDRDGDGFSDNDVAPMTGTLSGNNFSVAGVSFQNGDYFTVGSVNSFNTPLPVEMGEIHSFCVGQTPVLDWTTYSESDARDFAVERSAADLAWSEIGVVKAAGNSHTKKHYSFADRSPAADEKYYRLRQNDIDGSYTYFGIVHLDCSETQEFKIFPNPGNGLLNISAPSAAEKIIVTDPFGKKVHESRWTDKDQLLDLRFLPDGIYYLKLDTDAVQGQKIIIHR